MFDVVIAMCPAIFGAVWFFGYDALEVILIAVIAAVVSEAVIQKLRGREVTITDGSAIVTGILLAFNIPANCPWWLPAVGSAFAVIIGKHAFGGLGFNPVNPALLGRAFLLASWPIRMTASWTAPIRGGSISGITDTAQKGIDAVTSATPLAVMKDQIAVLGDPNASVDAMVVANRAITELTSIESLKNLFLGSIGGCLGETSTLLLLIGATYLMYKRIVGFSIPFSYIGTVAILTWIFGGPEGFFSGSPIFHVLAGGLILGAFYMATDLVTSPITRKGRIVFGVGCGVLTTVIRLIGGYPEGVSYSILLMNLATPLIDRYMKPAKFGG
jgi:electron transport complex protein RnfD